jgi:hypothetical protein
MEDNEQTSIVENQLQASPAKTYPTMADEDGFYIENDTDEEMGIFTKVYENGSKVKRAYLPSAKKTAVVRELLAKDSKYITRYMNGDPEAYKMAATTTATTIDGKPETFEFFENLKMKDYTKIGSMVQDLNF